MSIPSRCKISPGPRQLIKWCLRERLVVDRRSTEDRQKIGLSDSTICRRRNRALMPNSGRTSVSNYFRFEDSLSTGPHSPFPVITSYTFATKVQCSTLQHCTVWFSKYHLVASFLLFDITSTRTLTFECQVKQAEGRWEIDAPMKLAGRICLVLNPTTWFKDR